MVAAGKTSFYEVKDGATYYYEYKAKAFEKKPGQDAFIILDNIREKPAVYKMQGWYFTILEMVF